MLYLLHGPDSYSRSEEIARIKASIGDPSLVDLNTTILDGRQVTLADLLHACDALPFLAEKRLVIVEGLASRLSSPEEEKVLSSAAKGKGLLKDIVGYLSRLPETTCLILVENETVKENHPLYKETAARGKEFAKHFPLLQGADLERWISQRAKRKGAQIDSQAVKELTIYAGSNTRLLDIELEKLATYMGGKQPIRVEDVHRLVSYVREESIFRLVDALGERNGPAAIQVLHQLMEDSPEPSYALYVLSMIARQFRLLMQAKEMVEQRLPAVEIMKVLHLSHRFILDKLLLQARNFSLDRLKALYRKLQRIDVDIKTGNMETALALDLFVAEVCATKRTEGMR